MFTFKTHQPTGRYRSFQKPYHEVKIKKIIVGSIDCDPPHKIRLMVIKPNINEDGNPNCPWKWIRLKKQSDSLEEAKDFLKENYDKIFEKFNLKEFVREIEKNELKGETPWRKKD